MMERYAVKVKNVSKKFKIYLDKGHSLRDHALTRHRGRYEDRVVLQDINFSVKRGEALGLIGENGSGKSTMLKLLTGIMYPDSGSVVMDGRVSALIELGAGFHPDMTGRENIYTNAAIFGLSRREIDARLDDIIAFSELGAYIDNPVRTYSSGMYMRLAFSVAINVDADILLVDEILAVGDAAFQAKCFNRMREIKAKGTTIVLVSHSMGQVEQICDRCIWINQGHIEAEGKPREVTPQYLEYMAMKNGSAIYEVEEPPEEVTPTETASADESIEKEDFCKSVSLSANPINVISAHILNEAGERIKKTSSGKNLFLSVSYQSAISYDEAIAGFSVYRNDGVCCYGSSTQIDGLRPFPIGKGSHEMMVLIPEGKLLSGEYGFDWALAKPDGEQIVYQRNIAQIEIISTTQEIGLFAMQHSWNIDGEG